VTTRDIPTTCIARFKRTRSAVKEMARSDWRGVLVFGEVRAGLKSNPDYSRAPEQRKYQHQKSKPLKPF
jgi:hypothetical protein